MRTETRNAQKESAEEGEHLYCGFFLCVQCLLCEKKLGDLKTLWKSFSISMEIA
jgi:hypothetical protein